MVPVRFLYKLKFCFTLSYRLVGDENGNEKLEILYCKLYSLVLNHFHKILHPIQELSGFFAARAGTFLEKKNPVGCAVTKEKLKIETFKKRIIM